MTPQILIVIGYIIAIFIAVVVGFKPGQSPVMAAMVLFPVAVFFLNRPQVLAMIIIALYASTITLPFFPQNFNMYLLLSFLMTVMMIAAGIIHKRRKFALNSVYYMMIGYALVMFYTAALRGFGLRFLGGQTWGGAAYVRLWMIIAFVVVCRDVQLSPGQWKKSIYWLCILSILPPLGQLIYAKSGGAIWQHYQFIKPDYGAVQLLQGMESNEEMIRVQPAQTTGYMFCLFFLLLPRKTLFQKILKLGILIFALVLAGVSGHRIAIVFIVATLVFYYSSDFSLGWRRFINRYTVLMAAGVLFVALFARYLPLNYQRSVSVIPFANIDPEARASAEATTLWRIELWRHLLKEVPDYFWLGKGFAFTAADAIPAYRQQNPTYEDYIVSRNFHSGPLSLLILMGFPGTVFAALFLLFGNIRYYRLAKKDWIDPQLRHIYVVLYSGFASFTVLLIFVHGSATNSFEQFFFWAFMLEGLVRADGRQSPLSERPAPVPAPRIPAAIRLNA
ncbi:MAG: O-antigen ligase family protein [Kiritimatiellia bacterium]